ncbi:type II secretion system minor pseudopilin GspK [Sphingomicrobium lutaoense]|uniref:Type II secretion system protein K n=1 Tax=Sphingomicrobium lutaoense TaxID=515949 RepID=A0A839Z0W1_9SPHN|nr:type II secretion system minor pseudopilin GspK [Sphingomicrobium lutaoense]MBB3764896.1 general secretion pathway protein K [Sphingomicrobium lutaoense]
MKPSEKGTALLSVLLLVAVMAAVAATALDRLGLATRLAGNAATAAQARHWLGMAEELAMVRLEQEVESAALASQLDVERSITLPDGMIVRATLSDASNCFNLNSLARERRGGRLTSDPRAIGQLRDLMVLLGVDRSTAERIAEASADYIDSDERANLRGAEAGREPGDLGAATFPNRPMVAVSEWSRIDGVDKQIYAAVSPWLCAHPDTRLSALNVETLRPDQAVLLAMLDPEKIGIEAARSHLAGRPRGGYGSIYKFWNEGPLRGLDIARQASEQVQVESRYFRLESSVDAEGPAVRQTALIEVEDGKARRVARRWGTEL